jgi:hypothetical protein
MKHGAGFGKSGAPGPIVPRGVAYGVHTKSLVN